LRILIDESLPVELADELPFDDVSTVRAQRWPGLRNGVLLRAAVDAGFTVIVTADGNLRHQQNLRKIGIAAVVVLRVRNRIEDLRPLIARIAEVLPRLGAGDVVEILPARAG
jgi:predicted nuclease of predicted toxin-antitoxin system